MNNYWLPFLIISLASSLTTVVAGDGCCAAKQNSSCCVAATPAYPELTDKSLYQLAHYWTNDSGQAIQLASLAGRPQLVVMFFTKCEYACPLLVYQMQQIEAALPQSLRLNLGFTLVSFDTDRDGVAVLQQYRLQHALDPARWTLLRGSAEAVRDLSALLGVQFKQDARGQFLHSNLITLLNSQGEVVYQKIGLSFETQPLVQRIGKLAVAH